MAIYRGEPVMSKRQQALIDMGRGPVTSARQQSTVLLSERMKRGFKQTATRIAKKEGVPYDRAAAILAASSRRASTAAKRRNPRLKKVKGKASK